MTLLVPNYLTRHLAGKSADALAEIAHLAGFRRVETLQVILTGDAKLALDRVVPLADAVGCSSAELARCALHDNGLIEAIRPLLALIIQDATSGNGAAGIVSMLLEPAGVRDGIAGGEN